MEKHHLFLVSYCMWGGQDWVSFYLYKSLYLECQYCVTSMVFMFLSTREGILLCAWDARFLMQQQHQAAHSGPVPRGVPCVRSSCLWALSLMLIILQLLEQCLLTAEFAVTAIFTQSSGYVAHSWCSSTFLLLGADTVLSWRYLLSFVRRNRKIVVSVNIGDIVNLAWIKSHFLFFIRAWFSGEDMAAVSGGDASRSSV